MSSCWYVQVNTQATRKVKEWFFFPVYNTSALHVETRMTRAKSTFLKCVLPVKALPALSLVAWSSSGFRKVSPHIRTRRITRECTVNMLMLCCPLKHPISNSLGYTETIYKDSIPCVIVQTLGVL